MKNCDTLIVVNNKKILSQRFLFLRQQVAEVVYCTLHMTPKLYYIKAGGVWFKIIFNLFLYMGRLSD